MTQIDKHRSKELKIEKNIYYFMLQLIATLAIWNHTKSGVVCCPFFHSRFHYKDMH